MTDNNPKPVMPARFKGSIDLLNEDVGKTLWKLTGPMILAMLAMVAFTLVDTMYVGRLGKDELAAMSYTFPVIFFFMGLTAGIGVGASSIIARTLGKGKETKAARLAFDSLALALMVAVVMAGIGMVTIDSLFSSLGAEGKILSLVRDYISVWYIGMIMVVTPMVGNNIIRATGDTKTPMKIMLTGVLMNIGLDPLLIFGPGPFPHMGLPGAAWATVISRTASLLLTLYILVYNKKLVGWEGLDLTEMLISWKDILHVGAPTAFVNVLIPVSRGIITSMVAGFGDNAVAGYGAATRVEALVIMPIMAFCGVMVPFIGQNQGAGKNKRVRKAVKLGIKVSIFFGLGVYILLALTGEITARVFNDDPDVIESYTKYLRYSGIGWILLGINFLSVNSFNAIGKPIPGSILTIVRIFVLMVPLAFFGGMLLDIRGLFLGIALANMIAAGFSLIWLRKTLPRADRKIITD